MRTLKQDLRDILDNLSMCSCDPSLGECASLLQVTWSIVLVSAFFFLILSELLGYATRAPHYSVVDDRSQKYQQIPAWNKHSHVVLVLVSL